MTNEEKRALKAMDRFANGENLSCVTAKEMRIILNLIDRLLKKNEKLENNISNMYDEEVVISIMCDEFNLSRSEALELLGGE